MKPSTSHGKHLITLSDHLGVGLDALAEIGILNAIIGTDTKLFIDPKLVNVTDIPELEDVAKDIRDYVAKLIAVNQQATKSDRIKEIAISMIAIKEPKGLCIGYGNSRDSGTAISRTIAVKSLKSLSEMISIGIEDLEVMEMLGLFISRFGADSISDLISHIIYPRLCKYTERVAKDLGVSVFEFTVDNHKYMLPKHPTKNTQLIFIPLSILSELPLATSWEEIGWAAQKNARCRDDFNSLVGESITAYAKKIKANPALATQSLKVMKLLVEIYDNAVVKPYDIASDPAGYIRITEFASLLANSTLVPDTLITNVTQMIKFINEEIIGQFRRNIEKLGANTLLYHRNGEAVNYAKPVKEDAAQILFHTIADHVCQQNDIFIAREPTVGNGAVDFSIGSGYTNKVLVEIKKSNNNNLIDGYNLQVAEYLERENGAAAFYVVVIVNAANVINQDSQLNRLKKLYAAKIKEGGSYPHLIIINGLEQEQPSKLRQK